MAASLESVVPEALELSVGDRLVLASRLLKSVEREEDRDWDEEIGERIRAFDRGELKARPVEEALLEIRKRNLG